jgi:hypothetical protein
VTGREAYEEDVRRKPTYSDGTARVPWDRLPDFARHNWPDTLEAIAEIMVAAGYPLDEPAEEPDDDDGTLIECECGADVDSSIRGQCDECGKAVLA